MQALITAALLLWPAELPPALQEATAALDFSQGMRSLSLGPKEALFSARCEGCHEREARAWRRSRHSVAFTNPIFQAGFAREPQARCVRCHAPLSAQLLEVKQKRAGAAGSLASEGVNCVVCHLREGRILGRRAEALSGAPHSTRLEPALTSGALCAGCHQFNFQERIAGRSTLTETVVQNTVGEWLDWQRAGGTQSCVDCHMPGGEHSFRGGHDLGLLSRAIEISARAAGPGKVRLSLRAKGVGHRLPTGDLFRHLSLEVRREADFVTVLRLGRRFGTVIDERTGRRTKRLLEDTSLRPGEVRTILLDAPLEYRLRYHYTKLASRWSVVVHQGRAER